MLFYGVTITVSAISDFQKRDQFHVFEGTERGGGVKMDCDGFISVVLYSLSMSEKCSYCASSLSNVL